MRETLAPLLLRLPEDIQSEAVLEYLRRLQQDGDAGRLLAVLGHVRRLDGFFPLKLEAARLFLLYLLWRGRYGRAVAVYRCLAALEARTDPRGSRRTDALWHLCRTMLPHAASTVRSLWCALPGRELSANAQHLYARGGVLLLDALCRNADGDGAREVLQRLRELRHPVCRASLAAAEAMFRKSFADWPGRLDGPGSPEPPDGPARPLPSPPPEGAAVPPRSCPPDDPAAAPAPAPAKKRR
ncbi:hypothetical protein [uncultured Desulfovibrio sp.]|uniref:hypothetical protein n=1 Tax=uncultured Desulfovibrio sp. TaxID=167968 RepID=UPI002604D19F|nr:hypothetical protein [uncultured Desulfovibrio sp.]